MSALRAAAQRFGSDARAAKVSVLTACASRPLLRPRVLAEYHDALLFVVAYADDAVIAGLAESELVRVAGAAHALANVHGAQVLSDCGIAWSEVTAALSFDLACWLVDRFPGSAEITSFGAGGERLPEVLALVLPAVEADAIHNGDAPLALVDRLKGVKTTRLAFLAGHLRWLAVPPAVRSHLYDSLTAFVTVAPLGGAASRTFLRGLPAPVAPRHEALRRTLGDVGEIIRQPLPAPRPLAHDDRQALVDAARATLAMLARETDPITWPSVDAISLHELDGGWSVALFPMAPSRRPALDTHTGYLLMRNRVPVAYGGGWPFLSVCRTGVNVFPAFRGGESSLGFAQVLRVYHQWYGTTRYVVEPYQFGAGNAEGLRSGAFWFYWRLGFRPVDAALARQAGREFARLARVGGGSRTPLPLMRALTASDLALDLAPLDPAEAVDAAELSCAVSKWTARAHGGDRHVAQEDARARVLAALAPGDDADWPEAERASFRSLSPVVGLIQDLAAWSRDDKAGCVALMRAKGAADDRDYFRQLAQHRRLPGALHAIATRWR